MRSFWSAAVCASLALTAGNFAAEAKTYRAASYEVAYAAAADGTVRVEETIRFEFAGGPFTYVFQELPTAQCDGIEFVGAQAAEQSLHHGRLKVLSCGDHLEMARRGRGHQCQQLSFGDACRFLDDHRGNGEDVVQQRPHDGRGNLVIVRE